MNKKIYKGYELVKAIYDKQIKESTYIRVLDSGEQGQEITKILYSNGKLNWEPGTFTTEYLFQERYTFVLEDNTEEIEEKSNFEDMGYEIAQAYFEFYKGIAKALTEKRKESEDK